VSMLKELKGSKQSKLFLSARLASPESNSWTSAGSTALLAEKWVPVARCSGSRPSGFDRRFSIRTVATSVGLLSARRLRLRRGRARQRRLADLTIGRTRKLQKSKTPLCQAQVASFEQASIFQRRHTHILQASRFTRPS
jgi:hypothetical protein